MQQLPDVLLHLSVSLFALLTISGLITTTARKLDREQQAEHFLEVQLKKLTLLKDLWHYYYLSAAATCCCSSILTKTWWRTTLAGPLRLHKLWWMAVVLGPRFRIFLNVIIHHWLSSPGRNESRKEKTCSARHLISTVIGHTDGSPITILVAPVALHADEADNHRFLHKNILLPRTFLRRLLKSLSTLQSLSL